MTHPMINLRDDLASAHGFFQLYKRLYIEAIDYGGSLIPSQDNNWDQTPWTFTAHGITAQGDTLEKLAQSLCRQIRDAMTVVVDDGDITLYPPPDDRCTRGILAQAEAVLNAAALNDDKTTISACDAIMTHAPDSQLADRARLMLARIAGTSPPARAVRHPGAAQTAREADFLIPTAAQDADPLAADLAALLTRWADEPGSTIACAVLATQTLHRALAAIDRGQFAVAVTADTHSARQNAAIEALIAEFARRHRIPCDDEQTEGTAE